MKWCQACHVGHLFSEQKYMGGVIVSYLRSNASPLEKMEAENFDSKSETVLIHEERFCSITD